MKIVIDISEKTYKRIQSMDWANDVWASELLKAVHNGILLPKGHGRLIDGDELERFVIDKYSEGEQLAIDISDAPIIIGADKREEGVKK